MLRSHLKIISIVLLGGWIMHSAYAENTSGTAVKWGYTGNIGPVKWSQLNPDFALCGKGTKQSPVNISGASKALANNLMINYTSAALDVVNDGNTELDIGSEHYLINDGHSLQVNFSKDVNEIVTWVDKNYRLVQFHMHTPSENKINGRGYPLEIHFVHQGENGNVLVIAVLANSGKENPELQKIVNHIPKDKSKNYTVIGKSINPFNLLPENKAFYNFIGSLTTPPCVEGVQWVVMSEPISVSSAQIARLRTAMGGFNARPVQPLNKRTIYFSDEVKSVTNEMNEVKT